MSTSTDTSWPLVSVVLPVRNEAPYIGRCLDAVLAQDYPADRLHVIVADGRSTDATRRIVEGVCQRDPRVALIDNPGRIVPTGLNAAIAEARGDIVARVDGHCEIAPDYVRRCVTHLLAGADAVGGPIETVGQTPLAGAIALAMSSPFGVGNAAFRTVADRSMAVDTVAFPAWRREWLMRLGPFDEELVRNQDDEYNYRLRKMGGTILLAHDVRSRYVSRSALSSLWRQYFQYGYWKVRVLQKHPRQMRWRQFVPPLFVAMLVSLAIAGPWVPGAGLLLAAVALLYGVAALAESCRLAWRHPWRLVRLPGIFATLHVAYGAGFLLGLVAFRRRWRTDVLQPAPS